MLKTNTVTEYRLRAFNQCQDSWEKRAKAKRIISDLGHIVKELEKKMLAEGSAVRVFVRTDQVRSYEREVTSFTKVDGWVAQNGLDVVMDTATKSILATIK